jgi:Ca-activated chloride channel family protein
MNLLQPTALWALAGLPVILVLYILRPRHHRLIVPSVRLWQHLPSDLEGQPRWRLPVSSLLLVAQLLVAGAVAFALMRPAVPGQIRQHLILLIDTSPSMLATDASPNRLALAVSDAQKLLTTLNADDEATLISIEPSPRVLADGKGPHAIDAALARLSAAPARGDVASALVLASQTAEQSRDSHNRVVVLSDGAFGAVALNALGQIPADVSFQQVGSSDDNQAITALSVRPMIGSVNRFVGFAQLTNYANVATPVTFEAQADGIIVDRKTVSLPARGHLEVSLPLPNGTRHLVVNLTTQDMLRADDHAEVLVPNAQLIQVTLVATDPGDWPRAFKTLPSVHLSIVPPTAYKPDQAAVTLFVDFLPANLPGGSIVLVKPPRGNPLIPIAGELPNANLVHTDSTSAFFNSVDLAGLYVPSIETFGPAPWAHSIADSTQGPVVLDGAPGGRHVVVIGFDPATTDWPQRVSFPVFIANLVDTLVTPPVPTDVFAGTVIDLPPSPGANQLRVQLPDGQTDVFALDDRPVRFVDTSNTGPYLLSYVGGDKILSTAEFVVNRLGVTESDISPQIDPVQLSQNASPTGLPSQHEIWPWVVGAALAGLGAEWLVYYRRLAG